MLLWHSMYICYTEKTTIFRIQETFLIVHDDNAQDLFHLEGSLFNYECFWSKSFKFEMVLGCEESSLTVFHQTEEHSKRPNKHVEAYGQMMLAIRVCNDKVSICVNCVTEDTNDHVMDVVSEINIMNSKQSHKYSSMARIISLARP